MDTKMKVINESIKRIERRTKKLDELIFADHISLIMGNRKKVQEILLAHNSDNELILKLIMPLAEGEKKQIALFKKQSSKSFDWMDEKAQLNIELGQLKSELYFHENRRSFPL